MSIRQLLLIGLVTLLLAGCMDDKQNLQGFVADVRSRPSPPIAPIPDMVKYTPFAYVANDRRSPFTRVVDVPVAVSASGNAIHPDIDRPRDPLEAFQLDSLKMVGSMTVGSTKYALILAPDGVVYRPTVGDYAGKDYGEITAISGNGVMLSELVSNGQGGFMKHPASIPLSQ